MINKLSNQICVFGCIQQMAFTGNLPIIPAVSSHSYTYEDLSFVIANSYSDRMEMTNEPTFPSPKVVGMIV